MSKLKQSLISIAVGLVLAAGISYAWMPPSKLAPDGNADAPINVSATAQTKEGPLTVGGLFQASGAAAFKGDVTVGENGTDKNKNLLINGLFKLTNVFSAGVVLNVAGMTVIGQTTTGGLTATGQTTTSILNVTGQTTINGGLKIPNGAGDGKVLTSDGSGNAVWKTLLFHGSKKFTTNGTFTVPRGVTTLTVTLVGGGGGGGGGGCRTSLDNTYCSNDNKYNGGGGGGGGGQGEVKKVPNITVSSDQNFTVIVGAGGLQNSGNTAHYVSPYYGDGAPHPGSGGIGGTGQNGGKSYFGKYFANGGGGGVGGTTHGGGAGGAGYPEGKTGSNGVDNTGGAGGDGGNNTKSGGYPCGGDGGDGVANAGNGGGGGGGSQVKSATYLCYGRNAGSGGNGYVLVEW